MSVPPHSILDEGTDLLWKQFGDIVRDMYWTSDDNTVLDLTPILPTTRCVFARKEDDGSFLGCVVWNEYDEMAFIGFYILHPSVRGCGFGLKIWQRAIDRIKPTKKIIGLRAVPEMAPKYASRDTPVEISRMRKFDIPFSQLLEVCKKYPTAKGTLKMIGELTQEQKIDLLRFDKEVTGRDRSDFLIPYLKCDRTEGSVLLNEEGKVIAVASVTSTMFHRDNLFKLAPVYASSMEEFATLTKPLIDFCQKYSPESVILIHTLTGTVGEKELEPQLGSPQAKVTVTLFSEKINDTLDTRKCFLPHNNSCHFDG